MRCPSLQVAGIFHSYILTFCVRGDFLSLNQRCSIFLGIMGATQHTVTPDTSNVAVSNSDAVSTPPVSLLEVLLYRYVLMCSQSQVMLSEKAPAWRWRGT